MASNYIPTDDILPGAPYGSVVLSQRDVGLNVPINFVTKPGVSLTTACFPNGAYEQTQMKQCLSNLLAIGFRKIYIDLYWDSTQREWSFCPVQLPLGSPVSSPKSPSSTSRITSSTATLSEAGRLSGRQALSTTSSSTERSISAVGSTTTIPSNSSQPTSIAIPSASVIKQLPEGPLYRLGPYQCTTINLSGFVSVLLDYFQATSTTTTAHLITAVINVKAAANASSPDLPASRPSSLPQQSELLSNVFLGSLTNYIYKSSDLSTDRANLNASFYRVMELFRPANQYYTTKSNVDGIVSSFDAWPTEAYIITISKRLLLAFGTTDPQMSSYSDLGTIFTGGSLQNFVSDLVSTQAGSIPNCPFIVNNTDDLSKVNASWASDSNVNGFNYATTSASDLQPTLNLASNLTSCGLSTILNNTLLNTTAQSNSQPYLQYSLASVWSWGPGQPRNYTNASDAQSSSLFRCATISPTTGRWSVSDCSNRYFAACQSSDQPYNWTLTTYEISYTYADQACDEGYTFAVPRTGLENSYLLQAIRSSPRAQTSSVANVWIDFNDLSNELCWVTGGASAACPWIDQGSAMTTREIVVPTIAAVIVLVISILTIISKAQGNRKVRKRTTRRKANNGFLYEGVPS